MAPESTTDNVVAHCGIYETRPQVCKDYPKVDHYLPEECTFTFVGSDRRGECNCKVGACCNTPREGGEPGGTPLPFIAGGKPCKHLVWEKAEVKEKIGSELVKIADQKPSMDLHDLVGGPSDT